MKFLSSIVQHSLQLSKKSNTPGLSASSVSGVTSSGVTSQINQQNNNQLLSQAHSPTPTSAKIVDTHNEKTQTIKQKTRKTNDSSNGFEINTDEQPSIFTDKPKIETNNNRKTIIQETSDTPIQLENQTDSPAPAPIKIAAINNKKTETIKQKTQKPTDDFHGFEEYKDEQSSAFPDKAKIVTNKNSKTTIHETSETPTHLHDLQQSQNKSIIDKDETKLKIENKIETRKNPVSKNIKPQKQQTPQNQTSTIKPKQARHEPKQQETTTQKQHEHNNKHSYPDSVTLKNTQQDPTKNTTKTEKKVRNNYYLNKQQAAKPPLFKTKKQAKTVQQTPQVRIGQINVLIEDQAKAAPKPKATANTKTSSPFGYRGL